MIAPDLAEQREGRQGVGGGRRPKRCGRYDCCRCGRTTKGTCHGTLPASPTSARPDAQEDDPGDLLTLALHQRQPPADDSGIDPDLPTPVRARHRARPSSSRPYPAETLPKTGGCCATVVVTMTLEQLAGRPGRRPGSAPWTPAAASPPPRPDGSPAPPGSSPSSSAGKSARPSTSAASAASTPSPCASRWACATAAAPPRAASSPRLDVPRPPRHPLVSEGGPHQRRRPAACSAPTTTAVGFPPQLPCREN